MASVQALVRAEAVSVHCSLVRMREVQLMLPEGM
jgi:hypothetical protein